MSKASLELAFKIIEEGQGDFDGEKPIGFIKKAEEFLGLSFPETYRLFLLKYGCGDIDGKEIYGIVNDDFINSAIPDGIWYTAKDRIRFKLPHEYILIAQSIEGFYAIDTSKKDENNESPVVDVVPTIPKEKLKVMAKDFGDFLYALLTDNLR
jgi:hypothetical protein